MEEKRSFGVRTVEAFLRLKGRLPLRYHYGWARILAWLTGKVFHYRRDVVMANLARSFPEMKYDQLKETADRFYRHFANTIVEMIWFSACRGPKGRERLRQSHIVEITNPDEMNRLYRGARQLMILEAHTGNWELFGGILNYSYGTPLDTRADAIAVTYNKLESALWNQVMADNRTGPVADLGFDGYVETYEVLRYVLARREQKFTYSFIADQYPYNHNMPHPTVDFLHRKTLAMSGGATLACKLDMAVAFLRFRCREDGGYTMTFVPICDHAAGMDPQAILQRYYSLLEEDLQAQPWNYLWTHKRWK